MGTKVQPVGFRLGNSLNWQSNWQSKPTEFADKTFRDNQLDKLLRDFLRQHGILMGRLRVQESIQPNGENHLILTSTYFVRRKPFLKELKRNINFYDIPQINNTYGIRWKRRNFLKQYVPIALTEIIQVQAPVLVKKFLEEMHRPNYKPISFDLRLLDVFKVSPKHSAAVHASRMAMSRRDRIAMRQPYSKDVYFLIHKMILMQDTTMLGELVAHLLEKTKKHHLVLNKIEQLITIVSKQYKGINGIRIQTKGRIGGSKRKRKRNLQIGALALQRISLPMDFTNNTSVTRFGTTSVRIWMA